MPEDTAFNIIYKTARGLVFFCNVSIYIVGGVTPFFYHIIVVNVGTEQFRRTTCHYLQLAMYYKNVTIMTSYYKLNTKEVRKNEIT